jgi:hypothetical protein
MSDITRRREFISLLGGAAAWPLAARAQQPERMRRIGVLVPFTADDLPGRARLATFVQALQKLGWTDGRNVRIEPRWGGGNAGDIRKFAADGDQPQDCQGPRPDRAARPARSRRRGDRMKRREFARADE